MNKALVAYFSASGITKDVAIKLSRAEDADIFEIKPKIPYTAQDLDWRNSNSRSTLEMRDKNCRPEILGKVENMDKYDVIFLGFPIWWGREPSIIDTFLEQYNFRYKKIILFYTSGGSDIGDTVQRVKSIVSEGAVVEAGNRLGGKISEESLKIWLKGLGL